MQHTFTKQSVVGDIVTVFPKASDLFKANRIDFCCGGYQTIEEAAGKRGIQTENLLEQLQSLYSQYHAEEGNKNWGEAAYSELVDHIIHTHHHYLNEELPQLAPYVTKVFRVHGEHDPHLAQVHKLYNELKTELEQHTIKEEQQVFPLIMQYEQEPTKENLEHILSVLDELESEHDEAGNIMKTLRDITSDFTPPAHACRTYRMVYDRLEDLENDLFQHVHLENNVLFKRLSSVQ